MDNKLKAISNNVSNNDTIVDLIKESDDRLEAIEASSEHVCHKNVPVLFTTIRGVHLRKSNKSSSNSYSISFCDLERWVRAMRPTVETRENLIISALEPSQSHRVDWIDAA